jgi:DNA-binding NarL/FixJ family response regulator
VNENKSGLIQVMIISPIPSIRVGLKTILESISEVKVTAEAAALDETSRLPLSVDIVLIAGFESPNSTRLNTVLAANPAQAFLFLINPSSTGLPPLFHGQQMLGWINMDAAPEEIGAAIHALQAGLLVIEPTFASQVFANPETGRANSTGETTESTYDPLTPRESDVLEFLAQGMANKEIARRLTISEHTVKYHVSSIYSKLGVNNRTEAVRQGVRLGIIVI